MNNLLFFEKMITPKIITLIFWLLLIGVVLWGVRSMFGGFEGFTIGKFFGGLVFIAFGAIGARIWCELLIVMFKMNEALQDIRQK